MAGGEFNETSAAPGVRSPKRRRGHRPVHFSHSREIRQQICNRLRWLGVAMDPSANDQAKQRTGAKTSEVDILIIPTSEETTIGRHCSCKTVRELEDLRRPLPRSRATSPRHPRLPDKAANGRLI